MDAKLPATDAREGNPCIQFVPPGDKNFRPLKAQKKRSKNRRAKPALRQHPIWYFYLTFSPSPCLEYCSLRIFSFQYKALTQVHHMGYFYHN